MPVTAVAFGAQHVVEDRVEKRLRLTRAGAGGDQRGFRATGCPTGALAAEPLEGLSLVAVRFEALVPVQAVAPARLGSFEGKPQPDVGALEEPLIRIRQEVLDGGLRVPVRQRERGGEVVGKPAAQVPGLAGGQELGHQDFSFQHAREVRVGLPHVFLAVKALERELEDVLDAALRVRPGAVFQGQIFAGLAVEPVHVARNLATVGVVEVVALVALQNGELGSIYCAEIFHVQTHGEASKNVDFDHQLAAVFGRSNG